ncbi:alpha/beta hydrolase [Aliikangiella maris]|uniref:Alpha/beta fold hydrolase n=2 Tax=Aliikangiella maris TaxID=3162458 RepID=A0ABV2BZ81_9GAMM
MKLLVVVIIFYLAICALLYLFQRQLLYFPTSKIQHSFAETLLKSGQDVVKLITVNPERQQALIYFGGNAEVVAQSAGELQTQLADVTVYLLNYRGYGGSTGMVSEKHNYHDALAVYDYIKNKHKQIHVLGRSLGSGVATYLATQRNIEKLILITPFDSIENVAQEKFPFFPVKFLLRDKYRSNERAKNIHKPVLIIAAEQDEVIPRERTEALASEFSEQQLSYVVIPEAMHNDISDHDAYYRNLSEFIKN